MKELTKEFLEHKIYIDRLSSPQIAKIVGCSSSLVNKRIKQWGVIDYIDKIVTKDYLVEEYTNKKQYLKQVAKNVKSSPTIIKQKLLEYGIPIVDWTREKTANTLTKEFLTQRYVDEKRNISQIAIETGCDYNTVLKYLNINSIPIRPVVPKTNDSLRRLIGKLQEYKQWRNNILIRDGYTCTNCPSKADLEIHHIKTLNSILLDFLLENPQLSEIEDKEKLLLLAKQYSPFWDINNGLTLCYDCHDIVERNGDKEMKLANIHSDSRGKIYTITGPFTTFPEVTIFNTSAGKCRGGCLHTKSKEHLAVISGTIKYIYDYDQKHLLLSSGDSFTIEANIPHYFLSITDSLVLEWGPKLSEKRTKYEPFRKIVLEINS